MEGLNPTLAKMIKNVYFDKEDVKNFTLVAKCESAQIYRRDKSKIQIYVVRGWYPHYSEETLDAKALVDSTISSRPRYQKVKAFFQKHPAPQGYRLLATGHSIGGAYVDQLIADGIVKEAITFNPAIQLKDLKNQGNKRYYNRNDFIYKLVGIHASNVYTINNSFFDKVDYALGFMNIIKSYLAHNLEQFEKPHHGEPGYIVQSVHLSKDHFEDVEHAKKWIQEHNYKLSDVDDTPNAWRFRQMTPKLIETGHYNPKTIKLDGVGSLIVLYK